MTGGGGEGHVYLAISAVALCGRKLQATRDCAMGIWGKGGRCKRSSSSRARLPVHASIWYGITRLRDYAIAMARPPLHPAWALHAHACEKAWFLSSTMRRTCRVVAGLYRRAPQRHDEEDKRKDQVRHRTRYERGL